MRLLSKKHRLMVCGIMMALLLPASRSAIAADPNTVAAWNKIAEDAVVNSTNFQNEGLIYMAYISAAVYDAVVAIEGGYAPYRDGVSGRPGASVDAAVIEAAYRTLAYYLPGQASFLDPRYTAALAAIADGQAKLDGIAVGEAASSLIIRLRMNDGRMALASTSDFPHLTPGPGVWRLTPPAYVAAQTPWVKDVTPFLIDVADRFLPEPPPSLLSDEWTEAYNEIRTVRERHQHGAHLGADRHRPVLDGTRDSAIQPGPP